VANGAGRRSRSEVVVTRTQPWLQCRVQNGPPPRSLAAEANGASWSGSAMDPTEYKVAARETRPAAGSPRINDTQRRG
jgi:hypothetical protein